MASRILTVDDDFPMTKLTVRLLESFGYEVLGLSDSSEALDAVRSFDPQVCILDINMPSVSGSELLDEIKSTNPNTEVILLTGVDDTMTAVDLMKRGAADFLLKPIGRKQLEVSVMRALERRHLILENMAYKLHLETLVEERSKALEELIDRLTRSREELATSYEALKANKDDLVRSEKLAFTGRMAAGIAHEIRNPLTNIILSLRQLKKNDKIKPESFQYAEIIERNSNRIEYLVAELLNCARPIKLNLQHWNIHRIIEDGLNVLKVRLKAQKIKVIKNLPCQPAILLADKEYLGRVFLNILGNSTEAMMHGGTLSIDTKIDKGQFQVKIKDSGIGIPEKNLIKIFDPFFSTKKDGVGLGLSTCQNIVTSHGGLIEVESAWRKGTVFTVSLPLEPKPTDRIEDGYGESQRETE